MNENVVSENGGAIQKNTFGLIGTKVGMSRIFEEDGVSVPITVINVGMNVVSSVKTVEKDGYCAVQVGYRETKKNKLNKPALGHCTKLGLPLVSKFKEFRVPNAESLPTVGSIMSIESFSIGEFVNVSGVSKGKGYAGAIKRHGFSSQRTSHGNSVSHRAIGSTGMCQDPGRVFKGKKMSGHLGAVKRTTRNLKVVGIDGSKMLIMVRGSVPGNNGSQVVVKPAVGKKNRKLGN
tara:strand:- start:979 stop:1680 length:702 start_codon:yes stop_codon:yes gene_type:complete